MSYPNQPPVAPGDGDDLTREDADERGGDIAAGDPDVLTGDDDRPLDPDVDDDAISSAAADERAATEGTLDSEVDDRP
jgi:hypothetical protein